MYESLKPLGALSIAVGWASMVFLVIQWPGNKSMSLSKHAAAHKTAYLTIAILESVFIPMYLVFIATWFRHTFQLPIAFTILNGVSAIGLLIAAWVPDSQGVRGFIHSLAAKPAYVCMIASCLLIAYSDKVAKFPRIFSLVAFVYMIIAAFYLLKHEKGKRNFIYFQVTFLASIYLSVLFATYIRTKP